MISDNDIKSFCKSRGTFSIPLIQLELSVSYKSAARVVDELVGAGAASPLPDGISYEYVVKERMAPSNGKRADSTSSDSQADDFTDGYREYLKRIVDKRFEMVCREDDADCDDGEAEEETKEDSAAEYFKRRRHELLARIREANAGKADPFKEDSNGEDMRKKLLDLLSAGDERSKLAVSALKLCVNEGYITTWRICKNLGTDENNAGIICLILNMGGFIKRAFGNDDRYIPNVPEDMFFACCREAEERKKSLGRLDAVLKNIGKQKEQKKQKVPAKRAGRRAGYDDRRFREEVRAKLISLVCTDLAMSRAKAIIKAEGCLFAARDIGNDRATAVYEKVVFELNNMSDYLFNRLKSRHGS